MIDLPASAALGFGPLSGVCSSRPTIGAGANPEQHDSR